MKVTCISLTLEQKEKIAKIAKIKGVSIAHLCREGINGIIKRFEEEEYKAFKKEQEMYYAQKIIINPGG